MAIGTGKIGMFLAKTFGPFSGKIDVNETAKMIKEAGDDLFFTRQEQSEVASKSFETWIEWFKTAVSENTIRSKTRRFLAILSSLIFGCSWSLLLLFFHSIRLMQNLFLG